MHARWISVGFWMAMAPRECTSHGETLMEAKVEVEVIVGGMFGGVVDKECSCTFSAAALTRDRETAG